MTTISVKDLKKEYKLKGGKKIKAVDGVSFDIQEQEIFGFLGPNGAGKSTTMKMLATIEYPTSGQGSINGFNILKNKNDVRKSIGIVFQDSSLDDKLTAEENLKFHAKLYGISSAAYKQRTDEVLNLVDLQERRKTIVKNFSGGMKRRLEIARGLIHYPKVLFLDEPTIGLDPQTRALLWDYIMKIKKERDMTVFMTTHYMEEAEYCNNIGIIDHGKMIAYNTPSALKRQVGGDIIKLKSENLEKLKNEIKDKFKIEVEQQKDTLLLTVDKGEEFLPKLLKGLDTHVKSVEFKEPNLDDVFISLTGRELRDEEASQHEKMASGMGPGRRHH